MSAMQRPTTTADGAIGIDRNRSVTPLAVSACTAATRLADAEGHRLGEHAGHQELPVVAAARDDDAAAEHVGEEQHEDDREDQPPDDHLRLAHPAAPCRAGRRASRRGRAAGDDAPGRGRDRRAPCTCAVTPAPPRVGCSAGSGSARWPVSAGTRRRASAGAGRCRPPRCRRRPAPARPRSAPATRSLDRRADPARLAIDVGLGAGDRGRRWHRPRAGRSAASSTTTSRRSPPTCALSSSGVPSAIDPPAVDHHDLVGELVGLVEVLRGQQHGRAAGHERPDGRTTPRCGCAGRGRWSARRGTAPPGARISVTARSSRRRMPPE